MDGKSEYIPGSFEQAIKAITRPNSIVEGVCSNIDLVNYTCTVTIGGNDSTVDFLQVPLMVMIGSQASVIQIPAEGSNCLISFRDGDTQRPQLLMVDTVQAFNITVTDGTNTSTLEVSAGLFNFNGGNNGGMVLLNNLVTRLNNIENAFNSHVHTGVQTGAGVSGVVTSTITPTVASDIENTVIKQ